MNARNGGSAVAVAHTLRCRVVSNPNHCVCSSGATVQPTANRVTVSPFVQRAIAGTLPAKDYGKGF